MSPKNFYEVLNGQPHDDTKCSCARVVVCNVRGVFLSCLLCTMHVCVNGSAWFCEIW